MSWGNLRVEVLINDGKINPYSKEKSFGKLGDFSFKPLTFLLSRHVKEYFCPSKLRFLVSNVVFLEPNKALKVKQSIGSTRISLPMSNRVINLTHFVH